MTPLAIKEHNIDSYFICISSSNSYVTVITNIPSSGLRYFVPGFVIALHLLECSIERRIFPAEMSGPYRSLYNTVQQNSAASLSVRPYIKVRSRVKEALTMLDNYLRSVNASSILRTYNFNRVLISALAISRMIPKQSS
jgi:hypothetical protein